MYLVNKLNQNYLESDSKVDDLTIEETKKLRTKVEKFLKELRSPVGLGILNNGLQAVTSGILIGLVCGAILTISDIQINVLLVGGVLGGFGKGFLFYQAYANLQQFLEETLLFCKEICDSRICLYLQ
jgi:hypothetical protein